MKLTKWMAATALFLSFGVAGCTDDITDEVSQLTRNTDEVSVAYNKDATARISVRVPGAWSASVACKDATGQETAAWLRLDPAEGVGNGKDYQWITAIADRNLGGEREAGITIVGATRGDAVEVKVTQDDGTFTVKKPVLSGDLKANVASNALLAVEYDKAKGGEPVEMTFTFDGDNRGLAIKDYTGTIEGEGSGKIELPITGTPSDIGVVKLNMKMTIEGKTIFDDVISLNIQSENFIFSMDFGKFVWGGDLMANKKGKCPGGKQVSGQDITGLEEADGEVSVGTDGAGDAFKSLGETYRINRGVEKWSGLRVYEHPGYVKLGVTANGGWIMTPELESLSAAPETVSVSIDFLRFDNETGTYIVSAEGAGVVTNGEVNNTVLPAQTSAAGRKWKTLTFTVQDATNKTRIKIEAQTYNEKGYRINIDNIVVMAADKTEVTEKLPAPELEKITYTPAKTSVAFAWEGVKGVTSYEASVAQQTRPDFRKTVETEDSNCEFADLEPGLYIFTVRALYAGNAEFNSDPTQKVVGTLGFAAEKLATPTELAAADVTSSGAKISWAEVSGAANYRVVVKTTSDGQEVASTIVGATSYTAAGLKAGTDYAVLVQALVGDGSVANEFDSDVVAVQFVTCAYDCSLCADLREDTRPCRAGVGAVRRSVGAAARRVDRYL